MTKITNDFVNLSFKQCSGQVCQAHGYQSCQCEPTTAGNWKDELLCSLCCTDPADNTCKYVKKIFYKFLLLIS